MNALKALVAAATVVSLVPGAVLADEAEPTCRLIRGAETPEDATDDVQVCRQDVWFHDPGTKVGNLAAADAAALPSWNTTKPTASVTSGAGGAYAGNSVTEIVLTPYGKESGPVFVGQYTGNLDTMAVEMYAVTPLDRALAGAYSVRTRLEIDGVELYADAEATDVNTVHGDQGISRLRFAYNNIHKALDVEGKAGPDVTHTIRLSVLPFYFVTEAVYLYDASEMPSGIVFNLEDLSGYTVLTPPEEVLE